MSYDMSMCDAQLGNDDELCPLRGNCKRWVLGLKAVADGHKLIPWVFSRYDIGKCELQIKINDEKENQENG